MSQGKKETDRQRWRRRNVKGRCKQTHRRTKTERAMQPEKHRDGEGEGDREIRKGQRLRKKVRHTLN